MDKANHALIELYRKRQNLLLSPICLPFCLSYLALASIFLSSANTAPKALSALKSHSFTFQISFSAVIASAAATLLSAQGFCLFLAYWNIRFRLWAGFIAANRLSEATHAYVVAKAHRGPSQICEIIIGRISGDSKNTEKCEKTFFFQKVKFVFDAKTDSFAPVRYPVDLVLSEYAKSEGFASGEAIETAKATFGKNVFEVPDITLARLFCEQIASPFFVFNAFVILLWSLDGYLSYTFFVLSMVFLYEAATAFKRFKNLAEVRNMRFPDAEIFVFRKSRWETAMSSEILPGDVISLAAKENCPAPCDAVLIKGFCVVNESLLTGESTPQTKDSVENAENTADRLKVAKTEFRRHLISSGTFVLSAAFEDGPKESPCAVPCPPDRGAVCVAIQTAYSTSQGQLLRTILYSTEPPGLSEDKEAIMFLLCLLAVSVVSAAFVFYKGLSQPDTDPRDLLLHCAMIITMVVPTELPMVLSMAINNALVGLAGAKIFCSESFRVPLAGSLEVCCFDKTGTLTRDEYRWLGIARPGAALLPPAEAGPGELLAVGACHSLALVGGKVCGDSLEAAAFAGAGFELDGARKDVARLRRSADTLRVLRRFPFTAEKRRMACVVQVNRRSLYFVVKGAGQTVKRLLARVPGGYDAMEAALSAEGLRVLATAWKPLAAGQAALPLAALEYGLAFQGFLVFEAPIRADSATCIVELRASGHLCVMVTGDNVDTSYSVAQKTQIVRGEAMAVSLAENGELALIKLSQPAFSEQVAPVPFDLREIGNVSRIYDLVIDGRGFDRLYDLLGRGRFKLKAGDVFRHFKVFARMSPSQKERLLRGFKELEIDVLMCGDGTNDVGALRQASVGVALAEDTEAPKAKAETGQRRHKKSLLAEMFDEIAKDGSQDDADKLLVDMNVASIASPFTARNGQVRSVVELIRHGRSTLAKNLQMYRILALSCLTYTALYCYLYLSRQKMNDSQATASELVATLLFLFVSSARPLPTLSAARPRRRVFTWATLSSVAAQMAVHALCIAAVRHFSLRLDSPRLFADAPPALGGFLAPSASALARSRAEGLFADSEFAPSVGNTLGFHLAGAMSLATFAANYVGPPFVESITANKRFFHTLLFGAALQAALLFELVPAANGYLQLVRLTRLKEFPLFLGLFAFNFAGAFLAERAVRVVFAERGRIKWA